MKSKPRLAVIIGVAVVAFAAIVAVGDMVSRGAGTGASLLAPAPLSSPVPGGHLAVSPPPFSEGIFPCSECHIPGEEVDTTRRELAFHEEIRFEHDAANRWCLDCHDANNRDRLHLADGRPVEFTESYRLCGQCHGPQLRDWLAGDHGRRTGSWSGTKQYLLCASCHNPHSPRFEAIEPMPPPIRQEEIR